MKILKIFGVVVAVHAAVFMFVFAIPGCRTSSRPAPQEPAPETGSPAPSVSFPGAENAPVVGTETPPPDGVPSVSFNTQRYNPTRPGSSEAGLLKTGDVTGVTPASTYKVQANDSLWKVAKKHGIGVDDLAKANNLKPNAALKIGQKLIVPGKPSKAASATGPAGTRTYSVKSGDTLGTIARRQGTTMADIRTLNPGLKADSLRVGQELVLPAAGKSAAAAASAPASSPVIATEAQPAPAGSIEHIVQPGEGLAQIARRYGVPQKEIAVQNQIADPRNIQAGQKLIIPGVKTPGTETLPPVAPPVEQAPVSPVAPVEADPVSPAPEASPVAPAADAVTPPVVKVDETAAPVSPASP